VSFEPGELEVERLEDGDYQGVAALRLAGCDPKRRGDRRKLGRKAVVIDVQANTDDGIAQQRFFTRLHGSFDENASEFFTRTGGLREEKIVGPADIGVDAG